MLNTRKWLITSSLLLASALALSACDSNGTAGEQSAPPSASAAATPSAPSPSSSAEAGSTHAPAAASASPKTSAKPAPSSPAAAEQAPSGEVKKELQDMLKLAKEGKAPGIDYAAHKANIDEVEKAWGKPDKSDFAGEGIYSTYNKKNAVFGANKGGTVFDIRSSAPAIQKLTLKQIEAVLGKAADTKVNGDDTIYIYQANEQLQLKFIIPKSTGKVDHISVYSPEDTKNNMAG